MKLSESAIRKIFCGECGTFDSIPQSKEYLKIHSDVTNCEQKFVSELKKHKGLFELYQETDSLVSALNAECCYTYFAEGLRLGILLGMEVLSE